MTAFFTDYNQYLSQRLIYSGEYSVDQVRIRMGNLPKSTIYNYLENRSQFPADLLGPLLRATDDVTFLHPIVRETPFMAVRRPETTEQAGKSLERECMDVCVAEGKLLQHFETAVADGHVNLSEAKRMLESTEELLLEAHDLKNKLQKIIENLEGKEG